tara:strand:+ start:1302 stop:1691 length:390 start_codon:yes stop_codon:yes gene_type:complete
MISKSLIVFLLSWISDNTSYNAKNFDTKIFLVESEEIQRKACKGKCPIVAFYKKNEAIYITKMDFENSLCNRSILIHEMIHTFQKDNMQNVFKEREAYQLQNKFLFEESKKYEFYEELSVKKCRKFQKF